MLYAAHQIEFTPQNTSLPILKNLDFTIDCNEHIVLCGPNGAGKSTLMKILARQIKPTAGQLLGNPKTALLSPRIPLDERNFPLREWILCLDEKHKSARLKMLSEDPLSGIVEWEELDGWNLEALALSQMSRMGFSQSDWDRPIQTFSHGEMTRAALIRLGLNQADLYLLDEPDNHLDLKTLDFLARWLKNQTSAFILITHNQSLAQEVAHKTWYLKGHELHCEQGGIGDLLHRRSLALEEAKTSYRRKEKALERLEVAAEKLRSRAQKIDDFKPSRSKTKKGNWCKRDTGSKKKVRHKAVHNAVSTMNHRVERLEQSLEISRPSEEKEYGIRVESPQGNAWIQATDLRLPFGNFHQNQPLNFLLKSGDRIRLMGPNGCGKSTLIQVLAQKLEPLQGELQISQSSRIGYFDQNAHSLPFNGNALEWVEEGLEPEDRQLVFNWLGSLGLKVHEIRYRELFQLSEGERARLLLARVLSQKSEILLLDEPINHLDLQARKMLLNGLKDYQGLLIFVSHDEGFAQELSNFEVLV